MNTENRNTENKTSFGTPGMSAWMLSMLISLMLLAPNAMAQQQVTGTVIDAETEETLPGVNIRVKDTNRGTTTNAQGQFTIRLDSTQTVLVFSFVGFVTQEVDVANQTEVTVVMQPDVGELDELVVIGYGAVRKRDVTGSVSRVQADDIDDVTSLNAEQSLQGKVSGVQITTTSGAPGASAAVRIRGVGTFNNSSPIYVVDGVILDDISFLNPADIESMEILKDASATAIYGSRGANGVVLVQTKSGSSAKDGPVVTVSAEAGLQQLEREIDLLNGRQFAIIANEIRAGSYNNVDAVPNTNWQNQIFDIAPTQNHQVSISGSGERSDYYVSLGYYQQAGIIDKSNYERLSLKINNTYRINEQVKFGNNFTIAPYKQRVAPGVTFSAYRAQPLLEPYYDDGSFGVVYNVGNPLADLAYSNNYNSGVRFVGNVFGEVIVAEDFLIRSSFGTDAALNRNKNFTPAYTIYNPDGTASQQNNEYSDLFKGEGINYSWLWENTVNYIADFDKHQVNVVGGLTMQQTRSEVIRLSGQNVIRDGEDFWYIEPSYIVDEANNINMLSSIMNGVDPNQYYSMLSYLGRVVYSYDNKYMTTITMRRDGSSKFAEGNRWGTFPSFALGWNIDRESFMQEFETLSNLKLRASWGKIGNEKITYYDRFSRVDAGLLAVFGNPDAAYPGATYGKTGNPDLTWETTTQTDIGLEFGFWERRLTGEIDFYNRETDDILVELSTPGHLGNGQGERVRYNAASVLNRGIEFSLGWEDNFGELGYAVNVVGNTIHNEVQAIGGNAGIDSVLIGGGLANGQTVTRSTVGQPIGAFYGYKTDGIFQNQSELDSYPSMSQAGVGDLRFKDINGDGEINGDDRTFIGSPIPDFVYGFSVDLNYKNWDMSVGLQGQYGNEIFNGKNVVRPDPYNFEAHVWDRWTGEGTSNSEPRPSYGGYNYLPSDRFIQDGSYLRLRSLVIGYSLPVNLTEKLGLSRARVYMKGTNLFTWTKYTGYTPEIGSGDVLSNGIDTGIYPIPRVVYLGFNTTF
ncbi:SusC/RagA family TonB-linked outer membrane protein [Gracilimonas mengyeensis]|uniref:TonB-linked outer membrane protein, SusC/RagA family n=1 Tax=Gracilimonas mengyeensis TaxID=1302730 RepID=A0A521BW36_9BACT|nr:TonB-dependent receptor [Gracilimonas mengyeensis]SMO51389.1 TonB-linked outer membrane protein, SusC/RagA family [Gracilimonas mengyeensis]